MNIQDPRYTTYYNDVNLKLWRLPPYYAYNTIPKFTSVMNLTRGDCCYPPYGNTTGGEPGYNPKRDTANYLRGHPNEFQLLLNDEIYSNQNYNNGLWPEKIHPGYVYK